MAHPLQVKIDRLRRQIRRLLTLRGLGWTVGIATATVLFVSAVDYVIHFQDRGVRLISSLVVAGICGWALTRFLIMPLRRSWRDVELARQVEQRWPELGDRLTSTIEFLKQPESDARAGSPALRRAVISTTTAETAELDFNTVLHRRPAFRALGAGAVVCLVAALIAVADPLLAKVALARLAKPFGADSWPKKHDLAFRDPPRRLAAGQPFDVELFDRGGKLPEEVQIHYLYDNDGEEQTQVETLRLLGDVIVAHKDSVTRPFSYKAVGGDDHSMPWIELEVVEPPRVESLQVTVHSPAYTGWPRKTVDGNFSALVGGRIELQGEVTKPLHSAMLHREQGDVIPLQIVNDGFRISLKATAAQPFVVASSEHYWFELVDAEDISGGGGDRYELRALADEPPSVVIEQPLDNVFVTADAVVPLRMAVHDDLAIRRVELQFRRSDKSETEQTVLRLYSGPTKVENVDPATKAEKSGELHVVEHRWQIGELGLQPGTHVDFKGVAYDYLPQLGESPVKRLTIITTKELEDRLAQRQSLILGELRRVLKMQEDARGQTKSFDIQLGEVATVSKQDVDHLQGAELNQRQIHRTLTSESEGVPSQIKSLLDEVSSNRLDRPDVVRQMQDISNALVGLDRDHLGAIERDLTTAIKEAQSGMGQPTQPEAKQRIEDPLHSALAHQDQVVSSLEKLIGQLAQWDSYRRFSRDIGEIRNQQADLQRASKELGLKTLTKDVGNLEPQELADLKKLSSRQSELARGFDKLQQQMEEAQTSLEDTDPLAAGTLADALHEARRQAISNQMRQSATSVEKNQLGQAAGRQQQVGQHLQELLDILANRREHELGRLVKKLREAQQELSGLHEKQQGLRKKVDAARQMQNPDEQKRELERLAREQKELEKEAERLARHLQRLTAQQASQSTARAGSKMQRLAQACEQCDAEAAEQQAQQIEKDLEEAEQQLAEQTRQAEQDLAHEQLVRMKDTLKSLVERQEQLLAETLRLEGLRTAQGDFTRAQTATLRDMSRVQRDLFEETTEESKKLTAAEAFRLALDYATEAMARAADLLEQRATGDDTQTAQKTAAKRLRQLLGSLEAAAQQQQQQQGGGAGGGGKSSQQDTIKLLTELKLLKLMQEDLNERYRELTGAPDEPTRSGSLKQLSDEQGKLAELLDKLSIPEPENPEDNPDDLPVIRPNNSKPETNPTEAAQPTDGSPVQDGKESEQ